MLEWSGVGSSHKGAHLQCKIPSRSTRCRLPSERRQEPASPPAPRAQLCLPASTSTSVARRMTAQEPHRPAAGRAPPRAPTPAAARHRSAPANSRLAQPEQQTYDSHSTDPSSARPLQRRESNAHHYTSKSTSTACHASPLHATCTAVRPSRHGRPTLAATPTAGCLQHGQCPSPPNHCISHDASQQRRHTQEQPTCRSTPAPSSRTHANSRGSDIVQHPEGTSHRSSTSWKMASRVSPISTPTHTIGRPSRRCQAQRTPHAESARIAAPTKRKGTASPDSGAPAGRARRLHGRAGPIRHAPDPRIRPGR